MASRAEQIMQAVVVALTVPPMTSVAAANVYRDLTHAIDRAVTTAIAVEEGDEPEPDLSVLSIAYRQMEVRISAIAKGASGSAGADAPMVEAFGRLMASQTLGGLAQRITEGETRREREALEKEVAVFTKTYRIEYRTGETSLEN
jgi:hypothetical protein